MGFAAWSVEVSVVRDPYRSTSAFGSRRVAVYRAHNQDRRLKHLFLRRAVVRRTTIKRKPGRLSAPIYEANTNIRAAAKGLHGTPLGAGKFIRGLSDKTLQDAFSFPAVMGVITLHGLAIVDGNPEGCIREDRASLALSRTPVLLNGEHLRRFGMVRIRYPRDPFTEIPNIWWLTVHPYVEALYSIPENLRLKQLILATGDLTLLNGHVVLMSEERQKDYAERLEVMDGCLDRFLADIEEEYADSQTLAEDWEKHFPHAASLHAP